MIRLFAAPWLLAAGFLGIALSSCQRIEGCEYTGTCPTGGAGGISSNAGRGGTSGAGGLATSGGGSSGNAGTGPGSLGDAGIGVGSGRGGESGDPRGAGGAGSPTGASSDAGAGGSLPCDGACDGSAPICDPSRGLCVECLEAEHCADEAPACDPASNLCVACLSDGHCPASAPACDVETQSCVDCTRDEHCPTATPLCNVASHTCVTCLKSSDCKSASAARCDAGTCKPCSVSSDCSQIAGKSLCDAGECVQCTSADETPCAGNSCDPAYRRCTTTAVESFGLCDGCVADSECIGGTGPDPDARCVPMQYRGTPQPGGFCLRRVTKTCSRPFSSAVTGVSLSRAPAESYCGLDQTVTHCGAVLDLIAARRCPSAQDAACGCVRDASGTCSAAGQGGECRPVGILGLSSCTYACGTSVQCPNGTTCTADRPYCH